MVSSNFIENQKKKSKMRLEKAVTDSLQMKN